jgi:hypothetical protein
MFLSVPHDADSMSKKKTAVNGLNFVKAAQRFADERNATQHCCFEKRMQVAKFVFFIV